MKSSRMPIRTSVSPTITLHESASIRAPIERCFALSTHVELVQRTLGMKLIGGVTTGHVAADSRVTWRGWKFGLPTEHHTLITAFEPPHPGPDGQPFAYFEDTQERGRFASFRHEHLFRQRAEETELEDRIHFALPFGPTRPPRRKPPARAAHP
jgi:ligand-binding SRPBCC domain-containing protein